MRLFNYLPDHLKMFDGSKDTFKRLLDECLTLIPDEPDTGTQSRSAQTLANKVSNLLLDWTQKGFILRSRIVNTNMFCNLYNNGGSMTHL